MTTILPDQAAEQLGLSYPSRVLILQSLVPIAASLTATQIEDFSKRLAQALFKLSDQSIRPEEASISFYSYHNLKKNSSFFYRMVTSKINEMLSHEVKTLEKGRRKKQTLAADDAGMSLVTFEEMENKVLLVSMSQALELENAEELVALNLRISQLLQIEEITVHTNPFRPDVFLKAVYQAWCEFDPSTESHHLVLRMLRPEIFLKLSPILHELNAALIARGILSKTDDLLGHHRRKSPTEQITAAFSDPFFDSKVRGLLYANEDAQRRSGDGVASTESTPESAELFAFLAKIQGLSSQTFPSTSGVFLDAALLREVIQHAPKASLTSVDTNTIHVLIGIFDFVLLDQHIPADIKNLIGQLQIPILKAVLVDKEFFFKKNHPARLLVETLAKLSVSWNPSHGVTDPLYQKIVQTIERVQHDFDQQLTLFSDAASDLANFIEAEEKILQKAIAEPIAQAIKHEKIRQARELATNDVTSRTDTGEIPGFVEVFLEEQWLHVLVLAHSVKENKPQALENTLKTMDDLIWSVKPKNNPDECKELVNKLPLMLSSLGAWLNTIKWEDAGRLLFFSKLAERHASIARAPMEMTARQQLEIAVNVAQKASDRRFSRSSHDHTFTDCYIQMMDQVECGNWFDFTRNNGAIVRFKLAWISPRRSRFIFTNRLGYDAFSIGSDELLDIYRAGKVQKISTDPVIERALHALLDKSE